MAETVSKSGGEADPLEQFLCAAEAFVANVSAAMAKAAGNDPDGPLITGSSKVVIAQFASVCGEIRAMYRGADVGGRREADKLLSIQRGVLMAQSGEEMAKSALAKMVGGGFFAFITQWLDEIKKLIRFIASALNHGVVPQWLNELLDLIDQLWKMIVALLSGIFGFRRQEIADEVSARAVNTMNELAALARMSAAHRATSNGEDD